MIGNQNEESGKGEQHDPLEGRDVGETVHVTESKTLHEIDLTPLVFFGGDRFGDYRMEGVEVLENDETGEQQIKITWEGELTKRLPLRWYEYNDPVTASEKREARRLKWVKRALQAAAFVIPTVVSIGIATHVMQTLAEEMSINGEPMPAPTLTEMAPLFVVVLLLAGIIHYGLKGGFPGMVGGHR